MRDLLIRRFFIFLMLFAIGVDFGLGDQMVMASEMSVDHYDPCKRAPNDVPAALAVPAGQCLKEQVVGTGVYVYSCTGGSWVLKAPEVGSIECGHFVGDHFLGSKWEQMIGSGLSVIMVQAPKAMSDIPWFLLTIAENVSSDFDGATFVQRLHTSGGVAPVGVCAPEASEVRLPYTADYLFYHPRT